MKKIKFNYQKLYNQLWSEMDKSTNQDLKRDARFALYSADHTLMLRELNRLRGVFVSDEDRIVNKIFK